jgi:imidazolonepropionase-like amidohydrolase
MMGEGFVMNGEDTHIPGCDYAILAERVFTGLADSTEGNRAVLISGNTIAAVLPADKIPNNTLIYEFPNTTLLPGFIDTHIHLEEWMLPLCLACGVTTLRDTGNNLQWLMQLKSKVERGQILSPDILYCGPILDGKQYFHPKISWGIDGEEECVLAVKILAEAGVNAIKLYVGLKPELVSILARESHKSGFHVLGHFGGQTAVTDAIRAGVDEIEHLAGVAGDNIQGILNEAARRHTWFVPTQSVWEKLLMQEDNKEESAYQQQYVPDNIIRYWEAFRVKMLKRDPELAGRREFCAQQREMMRILVESKANIAVGTDAPCHYVVPGYSLLEEIIILTECGMRNPDAIRAATAKAVELLGISQYAGTIETGKKADMVIVKGNPLVNISEIRNVCNVIKNGRLYDSEKILEETTPKKMATGNLPDISEKATEYADWKDEYRDQLGNRL